MVGVGFILWKFYLSKTKCFQKYRKKVSPPETTPGTTGGNNDNGIKKNTFSEDNLNERDI